MAQPSVGDIQQLEAMVELLAGLDDEATGEAAGGASSPFYDRLCETVCRLTSMERAGLLLYDDARKLVIVAGSHGIEAELLEEMYGSLEETPIAQRALAEDRVVVASDDLERELPARYARFGLRTTLTCTPVAAGGRWLGVVFADRGGGRFQLTGAERHTLWTLGKTAALAAGARIAAERHQHARLLDERIGLAREVHDRVMQRLFGVSLVLGAEHELGPAERERCADEIQAAVGDLRTALARPVVQAPRSTGATLAGEIERLGRHYATPVALDWSGAEVPAAVEALAQSVLAEALRNAHKHARPTQVDVRVASGPGTFELEVHNDGAQRTRGRGAGMGLRLAGLDALQRGGVVEFGNAAPGCWRVRLVVPIVGDR